MPAKPKPEEDEIQGNSQEARVLRALQRRGWFGATDAELLEELQMSESSVRRARWTLEGRDKSLRRERRIERSGRTRISDVTGRSHAVYVVAGTPADPPAETQAEIHANIAAHEIQGEECERCGMALDRAMVDGQCRPSDAPNIRLLKE